jgi:uncharacterized protein
MFFIVIFILLAMLVVGGFVFAGIAVYPRVIPYEETRRREIEAGKIIPAEFDAWPKEEFYLPSPYGYRLHGLYFPLPGARKTVVIVHGITWSLFGSVKYMSIFRKRGFNILIYDHRMHGLSGGKNCTFGFYEKYDLKALVDWVEQRQGPGEVIGTHGESLGGGTVLQHAAIDTRLSFVIADCAYSDLFRLFAYRGKAQYHLPVFPMINFASLGSFFLTGMKFSDVRPLEGIRQVETPILFCTGAQDDYVPAQMSVEMQRAKQCGISRLYMAPNARHAEAYWNNQAEYDQKVGDFLAEIGL